MAGVGALAYANRPLPREQVDQAIERRLRDAVDEEPTLSSALLTVYSAPDDRLVRYAVGTERAGSDVPARVDSPYHSASVGKTLLATVYGQLLSHTSGAADDVEGPATWDGQPAGRPGQVATPARRRRPGDDDASPGPSAG